MISKRTQGDEEVDRITRHLDIDRQPPQLSRLERWFVALEPWAYSIGMTLLGLLIVAAVWSLRRFGGWGAEG